MVVGGRFTPALVAPVATAIGKHAGEVTDSSDARTRERRARVGVCPGGAPIGGAEDFVGVVVREATASFIHARDVDVARDLVSRDLDVANESAARGCELYRAVPGKSVITGVSDKQAAASAAADSKVV